MEAMTAKVLGLHYAYYLHIGTIVHAVTDGAVNGASTTMQSLEFLCDVRQY